MRKSPNLKNFSFWLGITLLIPLTYTLLQTPKNQRDWALDQEVLADINFATSTVSINNIKNFSYGETEYEKIPGYLNQTYPLNEVRNIWYFQNDFKEPFGAHSFLSFEFYDGRFISGSVEVRKEKGESYNPWYALFRKYELQYMLVTEEDILTLRSAKRHEPVYMYKLKLSQDEKNNLFVAWLKQADKVNKKPEFYNTLTNACTINIVERLKEVLPKDFDLRVNRNIVFPKTSDEYLYEVGLIDSGLTFSELKLSSEINKKVRDAHQISSTTISTFIRQIHQNQNQL
jgi:hypothetical protein